MDVITYKIISDLWDNKLRTIQVALIIAIGAFAVGMILGGRNLTVQMFNADWEKVVAPTISLNLQPGISDDELQALDSIDGVDGVVGLNSQTFEWRKDSSQEWQNASLSARVEYEEQQFSKVTLIDGDWPEGSGASIEFGYDALYGVSVGDTVEYRINDRIRTAKITGVLNSPASSPNLSETPIFYLDRNRYWALTGTELYSEVQIHHESDFGEYNEEEIALLDAELKDRFDGLGIESSGALLPDGKRFQEPSTHPLVEILDPILMTLLAVGLAIIVLGNFLIYNSISAVITQQVGQIGVMKAIGATRVQILQVYYTLIVAYGLLASVISLPLAIYAAHLLKSLFANLFNIPDVHFAVDWVSVVALVLLAFFSPLFGSLGPILKGAGITVREAISSYGIGGASGLIDQMIARLTKVSYTFLLTLGNTFSNMTRVSLTQIVLVGSGVVFMAIYGVSESANYTYTDKLSEVNAYHINLRFADKERIASIEGLVMEKPDVLAVELWNAQSGTIRPATRLESDSDDDSVTVYGVPIASDIYHPEILSGRWFQEGDQNGAVLHISTADDLGVEVGDRVIFEDPFGKEGTWTVQGIVFDPAEPGFVLFPRKELGYWLSEVNVGDVLHVQIAQVDPQSIEAQTEELKALFAKNGIEVSTIIGRFAGENIIEISESRLMPFNTILMLLGILALLIVIVGGIGLSGMLSLSVLERTREIGVMRAIGASSNTVMRIFVGEGLIQGLMSWIIALPISIPVAYFASHILASFMNADLQYRFTMTGPLLWLLVVTVLSIVASWMPARSATTVSVRESLAYQ